MKSTSMTIPFLASAAIGLVKCRVNPRPSRRKATRWISIGTRPPKRTRITGFRESRLEIPRCTKKDKVVVEGTLGCYDSS